MNDPLSDIETLISEDKLDEARARIAAFAGEELTDEEKGEMQVALALAKMNTLEALRQGISDVLAKTGDEIAALPERERAVTEAHSLDSVREDLKA